MKKEKVFYSMIEIEREYFPDIFSERKRRSKVHSVDEEGGSLAHGAIEEVLEDIESIGSVC
jgi:hypothetical protein